MIKDKDLPDGWKKVKLSDVAQISAGGTPRRNVSEYWKNGDIPWTKISDLKNKYITHTKEKITQKGFDNSSAKLFPEGTIVYSIFATLGAIGILNISATTNQAIVGIISNNECIDTDYLYYCLHSERNKIIVKKSHATQDNLNLTILKNHEIPLPPLQTQKKIVDILEKAERLKEWRKEADELTDEFLKSTFLEMFGDPINNEHNFDVGTIRDLTIKTQYGTSKKANEDGNGIPILRMGNITYSGDFDFSSLKHIEFDEIEKRKYLVNKGDLLFNRTNSKELVGKSAVYRLNEPMAFAGYLIKLITDSPATSEFIAGHLNSKYGKLYLQKIAKNIVGMANINAQEVQNIPIVIPPLELQQKFASIVQQVEQLREYQSQSRQHIDDLFNVLMQKAFRGELDA